MHAQVELGLDIIEEKAPKHMKPMLQVPCVPLTHTLRPSCSHAALFAPRQRWLGSLAVRHTPRRRRLLIKYLL